MVVFRLQNPQSFYLPGVPALFYAALDTPKEQKAKEEWLKALAGDARNPLLGAFLGVDDVLGRPFGVAAVRLPNTVLAASPLWLALCSRGTPAQRKELIGFAVKWIKDQGYNKVLISNNGDHPDAVVVRCYGYPGRTVASLIELDL